MWSLKGSVHIKHTHTKRNLIQPWMIILPTVLSFLACVSRFQVVEISACTPVHKDKHQFCIWVFVNSKVTPLSLFRWKTHKLLFFWGAAENITSVLRVRACVCINMWYKLNSTYTVQYTQTHAHTHTPHFCSSVPSLLSELQLYLQTGLPVS